MSNGVTAMWDDADHYKWLAEIYEDHVRTVRGGHWPYDMDNKHYEELLERYRQDMLKRVKEERYDE